LSAPERDEIVVSQTAAEAEQQCIAAPAHPLVSTDASESNPPCSYRTQFCAKWKSTSASGTPAAAFEEVLAPPTSPWQPYHDRMLRKER
jgi:hypothetical protein